MEYTHHYLSPLGGITLSSDGYALTGLWFDGQKHCAQTPEPGNMETALPVFDASDRWLDLYFCGCIPDFAPPLSPRGSAFRLSVWELLLSIPYGQTVTYGEIARRLTEKTGASRMSAQAIGGAVGHNPISLIIPCHRVIGADGSLIGYGGGLDRKQALLTLEKRACDIFNT